MGGGPYYAALGGSRILNTSRADQSGADDADVSDWTKTNIIIVAVRIHSNGKETEAAQYKLRWRDETDDPGGVFSDLDTTGECKFGDATALVNGTNLTEANSRCSSQGDTWQAGEEVEGTKLSDSIDLADGYETELQFAVSLADGNDGHQYTFDLYDSTRSAQVGVLLAQITLEAGAQTFYQNTGQASMSITGALNKKGFKNTGGHAMTIAGTLATATIFLQAVGGYAMTIAGTLGTVITNVRSVGGHAMVITQALSKKSFKNVGGHAMTIIGNLATQFIAGGAAVIRKTLMLLGVGK